MYQTRQKLHLLILILILFSPTLFEAREIITEGNWVYVSANKNAPPAPKAKEVTKFLDALPGVSGTRTKKPNHTSWTIWVATDQALVQIEYYKYKFIIFTFHINNEDEAEEAIERTRDLHYALISKFKALYVPTAYMKGYFIRIDEKTGMPDPNRQYQLRNLPELFTEDPAQQEGKGESPSGNPASPPR